MDLLYTIDPNADEPIMLIDRHIGYDSEDGEGIIGAKFTRELMFLDTLNKSRINIWINSPGGSISDAEQIVSAILKSKTKVDTHNLGIAASCAGPIFLAGCKRFMMEHSKLMLHPVSGTSDPKTLEAYTNTIIKMLTSRSDLSEGTVRMMMNETTWLDAEKCENLGLCTREKNSEFNKPRKAFDPSNITESYKDFKAVVNKLINDKKTKPAMEKITNKLKLNTAANEDQVINAIESIESRAVTAENKLSKLEADNKVETEALNKRLTEITEAKNKAEATLKEIENKAAEEKATALKASAKESVSNLVKAGKIKNEAPLIELAEKLALSDLEAFNKMYETMPVNKQSPGKIEGENKTDEPANKYSMAVQMANLSVKNKQR